MTPTSSLALGPGPHERNALAAVNWANRSAAVSGTDVPSFFRDADPEGWAQMVANSGKVRSVEAAGAPAATFPVLPDNADADTSAPVAEFIDFYKTPRGRHPRSTGQVVTRSADLLDRFDSFADVAKIAPRPLLMIAGTEAFTRGFSEKAVADSPGNAELFLVEGATHVDLYDHDEYVTPATAKLVEFFKRGRRMLVAASSTSPPRPHPSAPFAAPVARRPSKAHG